MRLTFEVKYQTTLFTRSKSWSDLEIAKTQLIYEFKGRTKVDMCVNPIVPCGRLHKNAAVLVSLWLMRVFNSYLCEYDKINKFQNYKYVSLCSVIEIFMLLTIVESQSVLLWSTEWLMGFNIIFFIHVGFMSVFNTHLNLYVDAFLWCQCQVLRNLKHDQNHVRN